MLPSLRSWSQTIKTGIDSESQKAKSLRSLKDLEDSKIVNVVRKVSDLTFGMNLPEETKFKLYPLDTGLMLSQLMSEGEDTIEDAYKRIRFGKLSGSDLGLLYECLVCQSLVAESIQPKYHVFEMETDGKKHRYEIDFFSKRGKVYAVEVKSTTRFEATSIHMVSKKYPQLKMEKVIVSPKTFAYQDSIINLPIYMSFLAGENDNLNGSK